MQRHITLITGGARSGKSLYALEAAEQFTSRTYIATAELLDDEMRARAARHRAERGPEWRTIEEPFDIAPRIAESQGLAVVDCLTLWLSNWMLRDEAGVETQIERLCSALRAAACHVRLITNEVGSSIVPENALARRYRDWCGILNQRAAAAADSVTMLICGIPLKVK
jgi:adenosylcobinamide kinase/adenosylcobinamide-phosphate guanylyltransferase